MPDRLLRLLLWRNSTEIAFLNGFNQWFMLTDEHTLREWTLAFLSGVLLQLHAVIDVSTTGLEL